MKRLVLALMLFLAIPQAYAFEDVAAESPFFDGITYVQNQGIVSGYTDGTYKPDVAINRAEFTKIIITARFGEEQAQQCLETYKLKESNNVHFSDVSVNAWYAPYVCLATLQNIIQGYPDGTMKPGQDISFVEAAKIIAVTTGLPGNISGESVWYRPYVVFLEELHAIPTSITSFDQRITRGEMAEIIYRQKGRIHTKPTATYDSLVIGNIIAGMPDCESIPADIVPREEWGVLPQPHGSTNTSIQQYSIYENEPNEAFMSVYRNITEGPSGCLGDSMDGAGLTIEHFLDTGTGPVDDMPNYIGDIISAFGYFDTDATIINTVPAEYTGTDRVRAVYSLEGAELPGSLFVRIIAQKGDSYLMLTRNLENQITDPTQLFSYPLLEKCGGTEKPDRACLLTAIKDDQAMLTFVKQQVADMTQSFSLTEE